MPRRPHPDERRHRRRAAARACAICRPHPDHRRRGAARACAICGRPHPDQPHRRRAAARACAICLAVGLVPGAAGRAAVVEDEADDGPAMPTATSGVHRDVVVDHPGRLDSDGRFVALAVRRHSPRTVHEPVDPVVGDEGRRPPDGAVTTARVLAPEASAAEVGAGTALEVSLDAAWIAARRMAGSAPRFERYVVISAAPVDSPLRAGDRVLSLDGAPLGRGKFSMSAGDAASGSVFTVVRDESTLQVPADDVDPDGILTMEAARTTDRRPAMVVRSTTSGPSAGIVSALAFLDAITPGDLTAGLTVAGTGTITPHGYVGRVNGVAVKTAAAVAAGADVLFVHPDDAAAARATAPPSLPVVAIGSLREAVEWLSAVG